MTKHFQLQRIKMASNMKVSADFVEELKLNVGKESEDWLYNTLSMQIEAHFAQCQQETQKVTLYRKRPTFWEWLTRKEIVLTAEVNCKELMKNPPKFKEGQSTFVYEIKQA